MAVVVYSKSRAFKQYIAGTITLPVHHKVKLVVSARAKKATVYLLHNKSYLTEDIMVFLDKYPEFINRIAILDDLPAVQNMLRYSQQGIRAYCNSYMAATHYQQLLELLPNGQSWYPPALLADVLMLAQQHLQPGDNDIQLQILTPREKQIAHNVAGGKSNKIIARDLGITERTVKAHLGHIFEKLQLKDRMALSLYLRQQGFAKTGT